MNTKCAAIIGMAACGLFSLTQARADEWNEKTIFTFSAPVEVPGEALPAGTYVFRLADLASDRDVVQIFNKDESHLYGTFITIPDYRLKPAGKTIITFGERAAGSPEAVKAWFYPGENYGHEFVYPKEKAVELARLNKVPVPSMPAPVAANVTKAAPTMQSPPVVALKEAPLKAEQPNQEEAEITQVFTPPPPGERKPAPAANKLPATAGDLPLLALLGLMSLAAGVSLRFIPSVRSRR